MEDLDKFYAKCTKSSGAENGHANGHTNGEAVDHSVLGDDDLEGARRNANKWLKPKSLNDLVTAVKDKAFGSFKLVSGLTGRGVVNRRY